MNVAVVVRTIYAILLSERVFPSVQRLASRGQLQRIVRFVTSPFNPTIIGLEYPFELMRTVDDREEPDCRSTRLLG